MSDLITLKDSIIQKLSTIDTTLLNYNTLSEIEDLVENIQFGGRIGIINASLSQINDPIIQTEQKMLLRYIMGLNMTPEQRNDLFSKWQKDKLIDTKKLLTVGYKTLDQIVPDYYNNSLVRELVTDLMSVQALGQGKGEFGLSVLSKKIKMQESKGDLIINNKNIEVKTNDGGAARFTDQEVVPAEGFDTLARTVEKYVKTHKNSIAIPPSGLNMASAVKFATKLDAIDQNEYMLMLERLWSHAFGIGGADKTDIARIKKSVLLGDAGNASQAYARANFNYYSRLKHDDGVLYMDLQTDPISFVYYRNANDLYKNGLRFHANTIYMTNVDDKRLPYPQIKIVKTKHNYS